MGSRFCGTNQSTIKKKVYILVCTDYVTKWVEEKSLPRETKQAVVDFLFEEIFVHFGVPREIVTDQGAQFTSNLVQSITQQYHIRHIKYSPYHPQANGKVESTNKVLETILTKTIQLHHKDWADRLPKALWAYQTTWRNTTGFTPYELVYGKHVVLPIEFQIKTLRTIVQVGMDLSEAQNIGWSRSMSLMKCTRIPFNTPFLFNNKGEKWHDKFIKKKQFKSGDWALLFYSKFKYFQGKFSTHWLGPYEIDTIFYNGL
jgi:hypothetical protein